MGDSTELVNRGESNPSRTDSSSNTSENDERNPLLITVIEREQARRIFDGICLTLLGLILVAGVCIGTYLLLVEGKRPMPEKILLVKRNEWSARPIPLNMSKLVPPVHKVLLLQTNTSRCWSDTECNGILKNLQKEHIEQLNEPDIIQNFFVADDGRVYEGRGWDYESKYRDSNEELLTVAFLGTFDEFPPSDRQSKELKAFLDFAVMRKSLIPCYRILVGRSSIRYLLDIALNIEKTARKENKC